MASGDITKVQPLGRVVLPGGGNTLTGKQIQNKVMTWGKITCSYVSTGVNPASATGVLGTGGTFTKSVFGLETLDFVELTLNGTTASNGTAHGAAPGDADKDNIRTVVLDTGSDLVFALETIGQAQAAAPTNGDLLDLRWFAVGDAHNADLT
jgi:hypothetical protein